MGVPAPPGQSPSRGLGFPVGHLPASLSAAGTSGEAGGVRGRALACGLLFLGLYETDVLAVTCAAQY